MKKSHLIEIIFHFLFWIFWPLLVLLQNQEILVGVFISSDTNFYYAMAYGTFFNMLIFYFSTYKILPYYFYQKKYLYGIIITLLFFSLISFLEGITDYVVLKHFYFTAGSPEIAKRLSDQVFVVCLILNIPLILIVFIYRITKDWYQNELIKQQLKEEKLVSELQFLKSQINPHFLFNTLNNLFGMARQSNAIDVADGIAKLSNLMRYMLYDSDEDNVFIDKEINYIKDYIELQKLRMQSSENIQIDLQIENNFSSLKIAPLILIPFVENAFKHGVSVKDKTNIELKIRTDSNTLDFYICNTINKLRLNRKEENSGFGLKNVQKRLDLIYPNKHKLEIKQMDTIYSVSLTINTQ